MTITATSGIDAVVAAPPLTDPPLSLLMMTEVLVDNERQAEDRRVAAETAASAEMRLKLLAEAAPDATSAEANLEQLRSEYEAALDVVAEYNETAAEIERWTQGFVYLPELGNAEACEVISPYGGSEQPKASGSNQDATFWYDPFMAIGRDSRSVFGYPFTDYISRAMRAERAMRKHEAWQCEQEFWSGLAVPTNYHLTASPLTPTSSPRRTISAFPSPDPAPGTILGTAVALGQALAALDQAIAESDAGTGFIHATPYLVQRWMAVYPFIRDTDGKIYTVNHNLIVAGFGYGGLGPDSEAHGADDGVTTSGSTTFDSVDGNFTNLDIGRVITETDDSGRIPAGTYVLQVNSGTEIVLSQPATDDGTGITYSVAGVGGRAGGAPQQWAYATDAIFRLRGDVSHYPNDLRQMSPDVPVDNLAEVRAERPNAFISNQLLRATVLVDTTSS